MPTAPPVINPPNITGDYSFQASKDVLQSKYADANSWAQWSAALLNTDIASIANLLGTDVIGTNLGDLRTALDAIALYTASGSFTYTAPPTPDYVTIPDYTAPMLGTILDLPQVGTFTTKKEALKARRAAVGAL